MGVSSNMHVWFNQALSLRELGRHLVERGWSFDWDGQLYYWQEGSGAEDWVELPHAMLGRVLSQHENRRSGFFLAMYHTGEEERSRIHLGFSDADRHGIVLDCSMGRRFSPYHRAAIDFSYYLQHLLPDPESSNLTIAAIKIDLHHT